ncbi:MAG: hypothetical protein EPO35_08715 [Acidobacteria bacterium]|nr:MAG: hypothetical protein EPO35_08715 [Acidobacteriota bacterium]
MLRRFVVVLGLGLVAGACASAPINKQSTADLAKADKLVADGCYDCLTDALAIYRRVAVGKARPLVVQRIFETEVLLGLRLKELALRPNEDFDAARALVPELPPTFPAAKYLEIAEAVPPDPGGGIPRRNVAEALRQFNVQRVRTFKDELAAGPSATLGGYLTASLDCTAGATVPQPPAAAPETTALVAFRRENCQRINREMLTKRVTDDPRYVEAGVFVGRVRSPRPGLKEIAEARGWLNAAVAKWPRSASVTYALGALNQTVGDCRAAVTWYEKTLSEFGDHEDAHLGRLMCLSYLRRHDLALEEAGAMIQKKITEGEAYYWRAWNYRELNDLPSARRDSDKMKSLLFNDRVMTLAGQIEHDMDDLPIAEKDLTDAVRLGRGENCIAQWYWSLVQLKNKAWAPTAEGFVRSMQCYEGDRAKNVGYLDDMRKADNVDEDYRKIQLTNFEALIKEDDSQISASAFNAAVNYARAQNREKALEFCDIAARDPARAAQVEELRKLIVK